MMFSRTGTPDMRTALSSRALALLAEHALLKRSADLADAGGLQVVGGAVRFSPMAREPAFVEGVHQRLVAVEAALEAIGGRRAAEQLAA
jgi:hypothetical protein